MERAAEEGEVRAEVEAVQAVYGGDCRVLRPFPPHIDVYIRPRTADDSSQQFVEAVLGLRAGAQYPDEPPHIVLLQSKGLDAKRKEHLTTILQNKAQDLSSYLMLVALCEEAVEVLSNMNHPEGNCPLCLYPLFQEDANILPFMKLMSCFHCFHRECILRWWSWLQQQAENNVSNEAISSALLENQRGMHASVHKSVGNCPVCRMVFHSKDIEHVLDLLETCASKVSFEGADAKEDDEKSVLESDAENTRRQQFEALLKLQQENSGLIEPKKDLVVTPGMFLPEHVTQHTVAPGNIVEHSEDGESNAMLMVDSNGALNTRADNVHKHASMRRGRSHNPRKHLNGQSSRKQWIKKEKNCDH
uniref:E3 ubiquitin-protein ligase RNF25 n=1 Tax=Anthurium amnicola TaxID=1678845 RepID=A0A1D1YRX2_9ARAE